MLLAYANDARTHKQSSSAAGAFGPLGPKRRTLSSTARSLATHRHTGRQVSEPHLAACLLLFSVIVATSVRREAASRERAPEAGAGEETSKLCNE